MNRAFACFKLSALFIWISFTKIRKTSTDSFSFLNSHLAFTSMKKEPCGRYKTGRMGNPHLDFLAGIVKRTSAKNATSCGNTDVTYIL